MGLDLQHRYEPAFVLHGFHADRQHRLRLPRHDVRGVCGPRRSRLYLHLGLFRGRRHLRLRHHEAHGQRLAGHRRHAGCFYGDRQVRQRRLVGRYGPRGHQPAQRQRLPAGLLQPGRLRGDPPGRLAHRLGQLWLGRNRLSHRHRLRAGRGAQERWHHQRVGLDQHRRGQRTHRHRLDRDHRKRLRLHGAKERRSALLVGQFELWRHRSPDEHRLFRGAVAHPDGALFPACGRSASHPDPHSVGQHPVVPGYPGDGPDACRHQWVTAPRPRARCNHRLDQRRAGAAGDLCLHGDGHQRGG